MKKQIITLALAITIISTPIMAQNAPVSNISDDEILHQALFLSTTENLQAIQLLSFEQTVEGVCWKLSRML